MAVENLITEHIDIWTSAAKTKSASGRGSSKKLELYGVKKLRELILELAVRGKLVPQDPNDEPAEVLIEKSLEVKASLIEKKLLKKSRSKKNINKEHFFTYPDSWASAKIEDLIHVVNGRAYKKAEMLSSGTPILRVGNLFTSNEWYYSNLELEDNKYISSGDLIYAWSASFGPFIWDGGKVIYHYHIWKMDIFNEAVLNKHFSKIFLQTISERIKASGNGIAMIHMTKERMEKVVHPLPPIEEQHRIVAKVDELMALCDQLEQQTEVSIEAHQVLVTTLLDTLTNSADADELMQNWARISEHFDTLFTTEESIEQLKQAILQLAVMGKLVSFGNSRKTMLKELLSFGPRNGLSPKEAPSRTELKVLKLGATSYGSLDLEQSKYIDVDVKDKPYLFLTRGDILIQRGNSANFVGSNVLIQEDHHNYIYPDLMMKLRVNQLISPEFLSLFLSANTSREHMWKQMTGTSGTMPKISKKVVEGLPVTFPTNKNIQVEVVSQTNKLIALCDKLRTRLTGCSETKTTLCDVMTQQAY
ncbi:restriction endonuclease subunit S [Vibrio sp. McD22-P3]|uniref:restriction endonuclease subunit S n=1 Tax=Vibrio sp. McD22-P3 TaxID=2724880 RepID=UPI001F1C9E80|nr:restriction endonuclease subunit S [Vibrio sp. McD22-P3]MCF4175173.1 restriction endonuclease subunit S [Vibrio sp. McD22-P3]